MRGFLGERGRDWSDLHLNRFPLLESAGAHRRKQAVPLGACGSDVREKRYSLGPGRWW